MPSYHHPLTSVTVGLPRTAEELRISLFIILPSTHECQREKYLAKMKKHLGEVAKTDVVRTLGAWSVRMHPCHTPVE
jgi:hypothetical protein